jgi:nicotinamide riboside kinase
LERRFYSFLVTSLIPNGTRDGEHIRLAMHARFVEALQATDRPYLLLTGPHEARLRTAVAAMDEVVAGER